MIKPADSTKKALADILYENTVNWGKKNNLYPRSYKPKKSKLSKKERNMQKIIYSDKFGCYSDVVRELMNEGLDLNIPPKKDSDARVAFEQGIVVIQTASSSSGIKVHLNIPCLITDATNENKHGKGIVILDDGSVGNSKIDNKLQLLRIAEKEEIDFMINELKKSESDKIKLIMSLITTVMQ